MHALHNAQLQVADTNLQAVQKRQRAGDASRLDLNVAMGDRLEAERQRSQAATRAAQARARLAARFPLLPFSPAPLEDPAPLAEGVAIWRERALAESELLRLAQAELQLAALSARRARADRVPDPTLGVYTASEAYRRERIVGLSLSIPFAGRYREARMQAALTDVDSARARLDRVRATQAGEVEQTHLGAEGAFERWRLSAQAASTTRDSAQLMQRAYTLGEAELQSLLLSRRQALDAQTAALQAHAETLQLQYRLLVDAHRLWGLAGDD